MKRVHGKQQRCNHPDQQPAVPAATYFMRAPLGTAYRSSATCASFGAIAGPPSGATEQGSEHRCWLRCDPPPACLRKAGAKRTGGAQTRVSQTKAAGSNHASNCLWLEHLPQITPRPPRRQNVCSLNDVCEVRPVSGPPLECAAGKIT